MGTTTQKADRVLQSIAEVQEGINNLGGSLTDQTPFKDFKAQLDNIYDNLPKTEYGEGTSITLENCNKGKLDVDKLEGNTEQESTTGKNILKPYENAEETVNGITCTYNSADQTYTFNGTCTTNNTVFRVADNNITFTKNLTKISAFLVGGSVANYCLLRSFDVNYSFSTNLDLLNLLNLNPVIFATSNDDYVASRYGIGIRFNAGSVANNFKIKLMIANNSDTSYEKYTGGYASPSTNWKQPINSVTGNQEVVVSEGIETTQGGIIDATGEESTSNTRIRTDYIEIGEESSIVVDCNNRNINIRDIYYFDSTKTFIQKGSLPSGYEIPYTFSNIPNNAKYYRIVFQQKVATETLAPTGIYLLLNPITKQLSLGDRKIYEGDYFWIDRTTGKKYHHHKMAEIRLTSDMQSGWRKPSEDANNAVYCNNTNTRIYYFSSDTETQYLTHFIFKGRAQGYATALNKGIGAYVYYDNGNYYLYLVVSKTDFPDSAAFTAFLDNNYVNVVYPLATETDEEITGILADQMQEIWQLMSIKGTTIIETSGNLSIIVKARALKGAA